jgi:hypothetical protein
MLLEGTTIREVRDIIERYDDYTPGFKKAISDSSYWHTLFSDSIAPIIDAHVEKLGLRIGQGVPVHITNSHDQQFYHGRYNIEYIETLLDFWISGKNEKFDKAGKFFEFLGEYDFDRDEVLVVDDSGNNLDTLHKPVQEGGGIAIAFNPRSDKHYAMFKEAGIPILDQEEPNLEPIIEIARDPKAISRYCI